MSSSDQTSERSSIRQVVAASFIGTTIEWYDFFLYGTAAALVFNKLFFPKADPSSGTLLALATYGVGFAARPFGGIIFGRSTLSVICTGTAAAAVYQQGACYANGEFIQVHPTAIPGAGWGARPCWSCRC